MPHDANHFAHVAIVFVTARAVKDGGPSLVLGQLGRVGEEPVPVRFRAAHACVRHQGDSARVLEEPALLAGGDGGFGAKDGGGDAGGYGVQEEEVEFAFVGWSLCASGEIN